ncbi:alpha/beta hydrolase [Paenibacillus sp. GXUN7292]|uniref:alpha/beta hydrolase n=1 Tax=Paenibacillus sp. GXUN7292 TaxID=3422499 RepID=UPI003D7C4CD5
MNRMKETRVYKQVNGCSIHADIYDQGAGSPVVIYIHGGALIFGSRVWFPAEQIKLFNDAGFSVVNIDYRLAPETAFEQIIEDIKDALTWVRTEAKQWYDFDSDHIAVMGGSAGGFLSLLTGTMDVKPKAIVSFYGYGDILGDWLAKSSDFYCRKPLINKMKALAAVSHTETTNGEWERYSYYLYCRQQGVWLQEVAGIDHKMDRQALSPYIPILNVSEDFPPTLLLHGDQDTDVPYEQSVLMHEKLKEEGVYSKLITIEGADHVFDQHFQNPVVQQAFTEVVYFLKKHLR